MKSYNKRGAVGKQFMGFSYLFLLLFVGVGIVAGAGIFYGKDIDARGQEAGQIVSKVQECILNNDIDWEAVGKQSNIFYEKCKISQKVFEEYYVLRIIKGEKEVFHLKDATACGFEGAKNNLYFPKCSAKKFDKNGIQYRINAGSLQQIRREAA